MKKIFKSIRLILLFVYIVIVLVLRFNNPELTETQIFLNYWHLHAFCMGAIIFIEWFYKD